MWNNCMCTVLYRMCNNYMSNVLVPLTQTVSKLRCRAQRNFPSSTLPLSTSFCILNPVKFVVDITYYVYLKDSGIGFIHAQCLTTPSGC